MTQKNYHLRTIAQLCRAMSSQLRHVSTMGKNLLNSNISSTRGVVLVRIYNTDLKCAARGSLKMQDAKKLPKIRRLGTISQLCRAISSQLRHVSTIGKSLLNSNTSPICLHNMVNFGLLAAPQPISTGFASWQRYYTAR